MFEFYKTNCVFVVDAQNNITNIDWERIGNNNADFDRGYDGSITISNVQKRHEGKYKCTLTTQYDSSNAIVTIEVEAYGPVITKHSHNQTVFNGDGVLLICNAEGLPQPRISWQLNSTDVVPAATGDEFEISHAIHSDTGTYTCVATNEYGKTNKTVFIKVLTLPVFKKEIIVKDGDELELPCIDTRGIDGVSYTWKKDDDIIHSNNLHSIQPNGSLILTKMSVVT